VTSLIFAAILGCIYWYLRRKDRRMLRNGIVLVAACWFGLVGVADVLAQWFPWTSWIALGFVALTPLAVLVLAGFLIVNGVTMLRHEGRSLGNLLSLFAGVALIALPILAVLLIVSLNPLAIGLAALLFFLCSYFGVVFVVFLAYALAYGRMKQRTHPTAVVVLGSQIINGKVPPLLKSRLDKGLEVYRAAPLGARPLLIPSGGQGPDESVAEGVAMAGYLMAAGAPAHDVVAEYRAVNTAENLEFSAALAREHDKGSALVVVTNNYHVLRAALLSRKLGLDAEVVGSPTARYFLPSAFLREFAAILTEHKRLHMIICLPFLGITVLLAISILAASH
jgi:uncharacterized SAM-binding protein YcdF (DUF218 family)